MDALYLALAALEAEKYVGATAPNPPVGACLVKDDRILSLGAHKKAGTAHAEVDAIKTALATYDQVQIAGATLYVTLEPCNHYGKTPPCTKAILDAGIQRVVFGVRDPNRSVEGGGAEFLRKSGLKVDFLPNSDSCHRLVDGFTKKFAENRPWVVHKLAYRITSGGQVTMIPEKGEKTFTSQESLTTAHLERKKSDAILTGLETILADKPMFNVRHVSDHLGKKRWLVVMSKSGRKAPEDWVSRQNELGFDVLQHHDLEVALADLASRGTLRVLVEAGPSLSKAIESLCLWDERLLMIGDQGRTQVVREFAKPHIKLEQ